MFLGINLGRIRDELKENLFNFDKTLAENKIKLSKMKTMEQIRALKVNYLKKRYSITGSELKILRGLVEDYKLGKLSLWKVSRKSPKQKHLSKEQLVFQFDFYRTL